MTGVMMMETAMSKQVTAKTASLLMVTLMPVMQMGVDANADGWSSWLSNGKAKQHNSWKLCKAVLSVVNVCMIVRCAQRRLCKPCYNWTCSGLRPICWSCKVLLALVQPGDIFESYSDIAVYLYNMNSWVALRTVRYLMASGAPKGVLHFRT